VVGSSSSSSSGSFTSARASVKRRFMPPESVRMLASALPESPANSSSSPIFGRIAASFMPK
jgi:hypothetical protein